MRLRGQGHRVKGLGSGRQEPGVRIQNKRESLFLFLCFCFLCSFLTLAPGPLPLVSDVWANPEPTTITADTLEYFKAEDKYVATGNVVITKENAVLRADKVILYQATSDAEATGHVIYSDPKVEIHGERAELNLDTKLGDIYNALIKIKDEKAIRATTGVPGQGIGAAPTVPEKVNYWIRSDHVEKIGEDHYYSKKVSMTTCNPPARLLSPEQKIEELSSEKILGKSSPPWCFEGENVDAVAGDKLTARDAKFRIKGLPVLYSPYAWFPLNSERQTGFLFPLIGNSSTKGFQFSPAFFWAIDENKDATFSLDYFSKRGIGKGIEYRYLDFNDRGKWSLYHIGDKELHKDFIEIKGLHEHQIGKIRAFADINYVNENDFYKEYAYRSNLRVQRFLQSSAEISLPLNNARIYALGQYWVDLESNDAHVPQRLPEVGYFINPTSVGPFLFTMSSSIANFMRSSDPSGQRIDIAPTLSYSFGNAVQVFQSITLRETAYNLKNAEEFSSSPHRETLEYRANALTRFVKQYGTFTHIIEPSLEYRFIPETHPLPTFDSTELFEKTSQAQLSFLNTFIFKKFVLTARLTQPYNFNAEDRPLGTTTFDASVGSGSLAFTASTGYNFNTRKIEAANSDLSFKLFNNTTIIFGERYARGTPSTLQYRLGLNSVLSKKWSVNADIWQDLKGGGLRDSTLQLIYTHQCWAMYTALTRRPGDTVRPPEYAFTVMFELKGLGLFRLI